MARISIIEGNKLVRKQFYLMDLLSLFYFLLPGSTVKKPFSLLPSPTGKAEIIQCRHCRHFYTVT